MEKTNKDPRGGQNRIVNHNPFECMSDEAQYWIGFLAADGNLSTKKYSISMQLKDIEHILKYRNFINPILKYHDKVNPAGSLMRTVLFGNYEVYNYLISIGFTPAKSKTFSFKIPLTGNILRGVFDGDGSASQNRPKITTASILFRDQLTNYFDKLGIKYTVTVKHKVKDPYIYDVWVLYDSRQQFFDLLYTKDCVKLERKYEQLRAALPKG